MNLGELRATVHRRSGVDYAPQALTDLVNEATDAIAAEGDWPWLESVATLSTVPGTATYVMPTDWQRTRSVTLDGDELPFRSVRDIDDDTEALGYSTSGDSFTISPVPTAVRTVKMRYLLSETVMVADTDAPRLPAHYHGAIVAWAVAEVHRRKGNLNMANAYAKEYDSWVQRIKKGITRTTGPRRIRVRAGGAFGQ